jgi:hypothetical protein
MALIALLACRLCLNASISLNKKENKKKDHALSIGNPRNDRTIGEQSDDDNGSTPGNLVRNSGTLLIYWYAYATYYVRNFCWWSILK